MAVKRVILQQFSMRLNYLNKERSNIYQPNILKEGQEVTLNIPAAGGAHNMLVDDSNNLNDSDKISTSPATSNTSSSDENMLYMMDCGTVGLMDDPAGDEESVLSQSVEDYTVIYVSELEELEDGGISESTTNDSFNNVKNKTNNRTCDNINSALDTLNELKDKLPDNFMINDKEEQQQSIKIFNNSSHSAEHEADRDYKENSYNYTNQISPELTWRYRSSAEDHSYSFTQQQNHLSKKYYHKNNKTRNITNNYSNVTRNNNFSNVTNHQRYNGNGKLYRHYKNHNQFSNNLNNNLNDKKTGNIDIRKKAFNGQEIENWRNDCAYKSAYQNYHYYNINPNSFNSIQYNNQNINNRNYGMQLNDKTRFYHTDTNSSASPVIIGLSPPSESLLMQRRLSSRLSLTNSTGGCVVKSSSFELANQQQVPTPSG